jgi:hypothetical protein
MPVSPAFAGRSAIPHRVQLFIPSIM